MADKHDPSFWQNAGLAIAGILAGAGAMFGAKRRTRNATGDKVRTEIRNLQDAALTMSQEIRHMQEAHKAQVATMERIEQEHNIVIAELFREIKGISLSLREVATEVKFALKRVNE